MQDNDDDQSQRSVTSTVPQLQLIRKIVPSNSWAEYITIPQAATKLFGGNHATIIDAEHSTPTIIDANDEIENAPSNNCRDEEIDVSDMPFSAVPFNGDTDGGTIYTQTTSIKHFMDMNISVPIHQVGSNLSNISPIGNVSSRMPPHFDDDSDDDSDDDLDRILGSLKGQPKQQPKQPKQQTPNGNWRRIKTKTMGNTTQNEREPLNTTLPTLLDTGSLFDAEEDVAAATLGDCLFEPCIKMSSPSLVGADASESSQLPNQPKEISSPVVVEYAIEVFQKDDETKKRSRTTWLIIVCLFLILVMAIMIGVLAPSYGKSRKPTTTAASSQSQDFDAPSDSNTGPIIIDLPNQKPSSLRPASPPTAAPTKELVSFEENDNRFEADRTFSRHFRLDMGPMVGHTTHDGVILWAHYQKPAIYLFEDNYRLEILLYNEQGWLRTLKAPEPDPDRNDAVFATITNLEPRTVYRFEMRIMGQMVGTGSFQTAPSPSNNEGSVFEYLLASCMDKSEHQTQNVWGAISETPSDGTRDYPDFAIFAGDTIYLQEGIDIDNAWGVDFDQYWYKSQQQRIEPHFADFVGNTPIYATWNNHDYGGDAATKDQIGKEESLKAWNSLWPNPYSPGTHQGGTTNGIYYSFYWGDVHYIVTDDHWNRDPLTQSRWGDEQIQWIRSELIGSTGTFKVIVVGSDILDREWRTDLESIGAIVTEESIEGILFHSGDIHRNEYKKRSDVSFPYPIHQITSSGIAKVWRKPFAKILVNTKVADPFMTVRFFGATSKEFDSTWTNDPALICDTLLEGNRGGEHSCTQTIRFSDLTVS